MLKIKSGFNGERAIILPISVIEELERDELGALLRITDMGFYPKADSHFRSRNANEAQQYILVYCVDGSGWVELKGVKHKLSSDQLIILPKGFAHCYGSNSAQPWTIYWIHFDGLNAAFFAEGMDKPTPVSPSNNSRIEERLQLFEEIYLTLRNGYSRGNLSYAITVLFHFLGSLKFLGAFSENNIVGQTEQDITDKAIYFMRENIHKRLALKDISEFVGLSVSHFSALFQRKTGYSPISYFLQLKIQQACHYLDFSDMRINQISMMVGIDDPFYFSRVFSKTMGISPLEYRKKKKG